MSSEAQIDAFREIIGIGIGVGRAVADIELSSHGLSRAQRCQYENHCHHTRHSEHLLPPGPTSQWCPEPDTWG